MWVLRADRSHLEDPGGFFLCLSPKKEVALDVLLTPGALLAHNVLGWFFLIQRPFAASGLLCSREAHCVECRGGGDASHGILAVRRVSWSQHLCLVWSESTENVGFWQKNPGTDASPVHYHDPTQTILSPSLSAVLSRKSVNSYLDHLEIKENKM